MIKKAVILTGGLATRFLPISKSVPKEMLPILNKPVLQLIIEDLKKAGVEQALIINGRNKEAIVRHFDCNYELEDRLIKTNKNELLKEEQNSTQLLDLYFKQQLYAKGTGYGLMLAKKWVDKDPFVMVFGDELVFNDGKNVYEQLFDCYNKHKTNVIAVQQVPHSEVYKYGIIDIKKQYDNEYLIKDIVEKPKVEDAPSDISYIGPAVLTYDIFEAIDRLPKIDGKEIIATEAFRDLAQNGDFYAVNIEGERHDVGNKFGFLKANVCAALKDDEIKEQTIEMLKQILKDNN